MSPLALLALLSPLWRSPARVEPEATRVEPEVALASASAAEPVSAVEPDVADLHAVAEAFEAAGEFVAAADIYRQLADLDDSGRIDALDRARSNYDAAYLTTRSPRYLCWALGVAEHAVAAGGFIDEQEALSWRDNAEEDLARLQADARTTRRANCRFDAAGLPWRPAIAMLADTDFVGPTPAPAAAEPPAPRPTLARSRRAPVILGATCLGLGAGAIAVLALGLGHHRAGVTAMRDMLAATSAQHREFTADEWARYESLHAGVRVSRDLALGSGVAAAIATASGVALLFLGSGTRDRAPVRAHLTPLGPGAALRLNF